MICSVATIVYFLGYMPPPGTVITVPKGFADRYTPAQQERAERCGRKYRITFKVER